MNVLIAPYSPPGNGLYGSLGAAKKIEFFLRILAKLPGTVCLVNSSHNDLGVRAASSRATVIGGINVTEVVPRIYPNRSVGKFLNIFEIKSIVRQIKRIGTPNLVWVYNPYAFESWAARAMEVEFGSVTVLEFEDWVFARRGLHPKVLLDWASWRFALPQPRLCVAVNEGLAQYENLRSGCRTLLCPGVVSSKLVELCGRNNAFSNPDSSKKVVGYFGGLSAEKGAGIVLDLLSQCGDDVHFHVTGTGPLAHQFEDAMQKYPNLSFHGSVDESVLYDLMSKCDVLLNLHSEISAMGGGVFPFKIIEYVAAGRLVLSTSLPDAGYPKVMEAIHFVDHGIGAILDAIKAARTIFDRRRKEILRAQRIVQEMFSEEQLMKSISDALWGTSVPATSRGVQSPLS